MAKAYWIGMRQFKAAVNRNPRKVLQEAKNFLVRGLRVYKIGIIRNPWTLGAKGGGAPVRTGKMRDEHITRISGLKGTIGPSPTTKYATFIHEGTRKMKARPWLDHVKKTKESEIQRLYRGMLKNITKDLSK